MRGGGAPITGTAAPPWAPMPITGTTAKTHSPPMRALPLALNPSDSEAPPGCDGKEIAVVVSIVVLVCTGVAYNWLFLGKILPGVGKAYLVPVFAVLFNGLWLMAAWCYLRASCADPGSVPWTWRQFVQSTGSTLPVFDAVQAWQAGKATHCLKCGVPRPERSHHCRTCGICVLRMDHHCPWIGNCVGLGNHKYFLLLCIYGLLGCSVGLGTSLCELLFCGAAMLRHDGVAWWPHVTELGTLSKREVVYDIGVADTIFFLISGALDVLVIVLLGILLSVHLPLALRNCTTIEENYGQDKNPFVLDNARANLEQVLGGFGLDWFFPIAPWVPMTDGIAYPPFKEGPTNNADALWRLRYGVRPQEFARPATPRNCLSCTLANT